MPKILRGKEFLTGLLLSANFLILIFAAWLQNVRSPFFYALLLSLIAFSFLFAFIIARSRHQVGETLKKAHRENKNLQDYINASWSANRKILHEEKILAVRFMMMGISHEIGTPLGNALTSVTVLKSLLDKHDIEDENLKNAMELSRGSIERTIELVNKFKDVAQISLKEDEQNFRVREVLKNVSKVKGHEWKNENVSIDIQCPREMTVYSFPYSLSIVAGTILDNACEAYDNQSGEIKILCNRNQNDLEIKIRDEGSGIRQENLEHVFDPFFSTARGENHIGLGLPMAHNLMVNLFKGDLKIESEWEKGTTIILRFPAVFSPVKVNL